MALSSDLMGLGLPPLLALQIAQGGIGPLTVVPAGTTYATSTKLGANQTLVSVIGDALTSKAVGLPSVGGDTGASLGDQFVINYAVDSGGSLTIRASTGVVISMGTANNSLVGIATHTTAALFPISATQWVGIKGA